MGIGSRILVSTGLAALAALAQGGDAPASRVASRYTFSWPVGPDAPTPRGGTTKGVPVTLETTPSAEWQALQARDLSTEERDRRAILAMAGSYRVSFDFLEVASFTGDGSRPRPYQSWGTERVFVDRNDPHHISLVHILEMRILGEDGKPSEPMVTKHWRQDWRYEPTEVIEFEGGDRWAKRKLSGAERRGRWSQTVYQVDESPRYGAMGRWEHSPAFSSWISEDTARPLPRREWSVRKDYDLLRGTNRHTVLPTGWLQEENNLKQASAAASFVGREYGVARYERLKDADFNASQQYFDATRVYWDQVMDEWDRIWKQHSAVQLTGNSDQTGAYADLFQLAEDFSTGKLKSADAPVAIRAALERQMKPGGKQAGAVAR